MFNRRRSSRDRVGETGGRRLALRWIGVTSRAVPLGYEMRALPFLRLRALGWCGDRQVTSAYDDVSSVVNVPVCRPLAWKRLGR